MKKLFFFFILLMIASCKSKVQVNTFPQGSPYVKYAEYFTEVKELLQKDNGDFWNQNLYGPILLIDPTTKELIANKNNGSKDFLQFHTVFVDTLPKNINIANTAIEWNGEKWAMIMLPLPKEDYDRQKLLTHELYHRIQPDLGFDKFKEVGNSHLDSYEGRLLLSLELEALKEALKTSSKDSKKQHITNALWFRVLRHTNEEIKQEENSLEMNEGLAEYTAVMLSGKTEKERRAQLIKSLDKFYSTPSYVRSFAYQTIPSYGFLLSLEKRDWHKEISPKTVLTDFLITTFGLEPSNKSTLDEIARNDLYNYSAIKRIETAREQQRVAKIEGFRKQFLKEPTLTLHFQNMNISFDPGNLTPLEDEGTIYPNLKVSDNWGILTVKEGALLSSNWSNVKVTIPTRIDGKIVEGNGWILELNEGWIVEKINEEYKLKKK